MSEFDTTTATTMIGEAGATGAGQVSAETTLASVSTTNEALEAMRFLAEKFNLPYEVVVPEDLKAVLRDTLEERDGESLLTPEIAETIVAAAVADEDWEDLGYDNEAIHDEKMALLAKVCRKLLLSGEAQGPLVRVCAVVMDA